VLLPLPRFQDQAAGTVFAVGFLFLLLQQPEGLAREVESGLGEQQQ